MSAWEIAKTKDLDALAAEVFDRMDGVSDSDPLSPWADLALALIERCKETGARAHAEGLEAGLRQAARLASSATADPESRLIHPDIPFKDFSEPARGVAHATAQAIAAEILALIPAAPEVKDE